MLSEPDSAPGLAGFKTPYQPYNPTRFNWPNVQGVQNYINANDRNFAPAVRMDRHVFNPNLVPTVDVKDPFCRVLDARSNDYMPRRYPDPGCVRTVFPHANLRPAGMNGRTTALNSRSPFPMPVTGTNDTGLIVSMF